MNNLIKRLAEQANLSYMPSNYSDMADLYKCADFELEKFVELIINECADVCEMNPRLAHTQVANLIKIHFGVEE